MNPEFFLRQFDEISAAPDAIPHLRRFIFRLAISGKLVDSDPSEGNVTQLIDEIQTVRPQFFKAAKLQKPNLQTIKDSNGLPFSIPEHWACQPLCELGSLSGGMTPSMQRRDFWQGDINWFSPKDFKGDYLTESELKITKLGLSETRLQLYPPNCLFIVARSGILKRTLPVAINTVDATANQDLKVLTPFVKGLHRYLQLVFRGLTDFILAEFVKTGTTVQSLKYDEFEWLPIPLPSLGEQGRIVAKVDELMALCDQFEVSNNEREQARHRLSEAASHSLVTAASTEKFRDSANFYVRHLSELTVSPKQVPFVRQAILDLAIQGKVAAQNSEDEPASVLLERVRSEKRKLIEDGILTKDNSRPVPPDARLPFALPPGWVWSNLQSLCISLTDGDHQPPPKAESGIPFLVIGNVRSQVLNFTGCRYVSEQYYKSLDSVRRPQKSDILYTLVGSYGIPIPIVDDRPFCVQRHIGILRPSSHINFRFLSCIMRSTFVFDQATECATGIAQKTVPLAGLRKFLIPLPPLPEQERILVEVTRLMKFCDEIEAELTNFKEQKRVLLESALHHALN